MTEHTDILQGITRISQLGQKLSRAGVRALYIGDGDHFSTCVEINYTGAIVGFHPELLFIENGAEQQSYYDKHKITRLTNYFGDELASQITHTKICPVDDSELTKAIEGFDPLTRTSLVTHSRIADRIVRHIEDFYRSHKRMPSYAIVFGAKHFAVPHSLNEVVTQKLKDAGLPLPKAATIEIYDEKDHAVASDLKRHWFSPFQFTYGVGTAIPPGFPDICNPRLGVDASGHKGGRSF
jgi:hypothetical protein